MRKLLNGLTVAAVLAAAVAFWIPTGHAQTFTHNTTTLAANQLATDTTLSITSNSAATGSSFGSVQANQYVLVDAELELLVSQTATSTIWNVQRRGQRTLHNSGTSVYIGPAGSFQSAPPPPGRCVQANVPAFWINVGAAGAPGPGVNNMGGMVYTCSPNGVWGAGNGPYYDGVNGGNGATLTLTAGQSGQTFLFDRTALVYTLPAPAPGLRFDFISTVTASTNQEVAVATPASQFIQGSVQIAGVATTVAFSCNGTTHVAIKMNGTTTGGILGSWMRVVGVSTTIWQVQSLMNGSGTGATPCSTSV